jgi:hypothetical protein
MTHRQLLSKGDNVASDIDLNQFIIVLLESAYRSIKQAMGDLTDEQLYYQPTAESNSMASGPVRISAVPSIWTYGPVNVSTKTQRMARSLRRRLRTLCDTHHGLCTAARRATMPDSAAWEEQQQHSSPKSPRMWQAMAHAPGAAGVYTRIAPAL